MDSKHIDRQRAAEELSRQLRRGSSNELRRRRQIIGLSMVASASMAVITLYQTGILKHLPEPPLPLLNADRVDASAEAYEKLDTPDAALGLASYATTTVLAAMGGEDRASKAPWIVLALAGKLAFDALMAIKLTIDQPRRHKAFCFWCLLAASATIASVPLIVPEALRAVRGQR